MPRVTTSLFGNLAILPYPVDPPVRETLEYLTELQVAHDSTEVRKPLRSMPRQMVDSRLIVHRDRIAEEFNTLFKAMRLNWAVPLWFEEQRVGPLTAGASVISCVTSLYDFRNDSLALLYSPNGTWELIEIQTVGNFSLSIYGTLANSFESAWLMPARRGWLTENVQRQVSPTYSSVQLRMLVDDNIALSATVPNQFLSDDIYFDPQLMVDRVVPTSFEQRLEVIDEELGAVERRSPWTRAQYGRTRMFRTRTAEQARELRSFLARRQGQYRRFWYPTFEHNMRVTSVGAITTTLLIAADSYLTYASERTHVGIEAGGVWYARTIDSATPSGANVSLTLSSTLGGIDASTITRVSYLGLNRLATDRIELNWIGNNVAEAPIQVLEVSP